MSRKSLWSDIILCFLGWSSFPIIAGCLEVRSRVASRSVRVASRSHRGLPQGLRVSGSTANVKVNFSRPLLEHCWRGLPHCCCISRNHSGIKEITTKGQIDLLDLHIRDAPVYPMLCRCRGPISWWVKTSKLFPVPVCSSIPHQSSVIIYQPVMLWAILSQYWTLRIKVYGYLSKSCGSSPLLPSPWFHWVTQLVWEGERKAACLPHYSNKCKKRRNQAGMESGKLHSHSSAQQH